MSAASLVSQFGFPIGAFLLMFALYREERADRQKERKQFRQAIEEQTKALRSLRSEMRRAVGGEAVERVEPRPDGGRVEEGEQ